MADAVKPDALRSHLRQRKLAPVYFLFGAETYLRDIAANTITKFAFDEDDLRDFNDSSFSLAEDNDLQSALAAAQQLPMMARRRVIRVTDVRISATGYRDTLGEEDEKVLAAYLADPSPSTVLIFIGDDIDKRRKIAKLLIGRSFAVDFAALDEHEAIKFASDRVKEAGVLMDPRTLRQLTTLVGADARRLKNEIEKLAAAALPEKTVNFEHVESLVRDSRAIRNFELTDHLLAGRPAHALRTLKHMLDEGFEPLALLGMLSANIRRSMASKEKMSAGLAREAVTRPLNLRYRDQASFLASARRSDTSTLAKAIERIAQVDLAMKTSLGGGGKIGQRLQIEMLVCELALLH